MKINKPFLVIEKARKYATIKFDMNTCTCNLVPEAVNKIDKIFNDFAINNKDYMKDKYFSYNSGQTHGYFADVDFSITTELAQEISDIVMNSKNHYHCLNHVFSEKCPH